MQLSDRNIKVLEMHTYNLVCLTVYDFVLHSHCHWIHSDCCFSKPWNFVQKKRIGRGINQPPLGIFLCFVEWVELVLHLLWISLRAFQASLLQSVDHIVEQLRCWTRDREVWGLIPKVPVICKKPWASFESTLPLATQQSWVPAAYIQCWQTIAVVFCTNLTWRTDSLMNIAYISGPKQIFTSSLKMSSLWMDYINKHHTNRKFVAI